MEQMAYGSAIAIVSFICGLFAGLQGKSAYTQAQKEAHAAERREMEAEIKRLRAQNAMWVGKESE